MQRHRHVEIASRAMRPADGLSIAVFHGIAYCTGHVMAGTTNATINMSAIVQASVPRSRGGRTAHSPKPITGVYQTSRP